MELILNTKSDCFLCLKSPSVAKPGLNETCLKNICCFLKINTNAVLLQLLKKGDKDASNLLEDTKFSFSVNLCNSCYFVAKKLSGLIQNLEVVQLQVNYYSEVFLRILEEGDLTKATPQPDVGDLNEEEWVAEHLRNTAKRKCAGRINTSLSPVVKLRRLNPDTIKQAVIKEDVITKPEVAQLVEVTSTDHMLTSSTFESEDSTRNGSPEVTSAENEFSNTSRTIGICAKGNTPFTRVKSYPISCINDTTVLPLACGGSSSGEVQILPGSLTVGPTEDIPTLNMIQIVDEMVKRHCPELESGTHYNCTLCGQKIKLQPGSIRCHFTAKHLEKVFSFLKHPDVPEDDFSEFCDQAVESEAQRCVGFPGKRELAYTCSLCRKISSDRRYLKHHLVLHHGDVLCERVGNLQTMERDQQQSTEILKGITSSMRRRKRKTGIICAHCNAHFCRWNGLRHHQVCRHPEHVFLPVKPSHLSLSEFARTCYHVLQREVAAYSYSVGQPVSPRECTYCAKSHRFKTTYLYHFVSCHRALLEEKIKSAQFLEDGERGSYPEVEREDCITWPMEESLEDPGGEWEDERDSDMIVETENDNIQSSKYFVGTEEQISIEESTNSAPVGLYSAGDLDIQNVGGCPPLAGMKVSLQGAETIWKKEVDLH